MRLAYQFQGEMVKGLEAGGGLTCRPNPAVALLVGTTDTAPVKRLYWLHDSLSPSRSFLLWPQPWSLSTIMLLWHSFLIIIIIIIIKRNITLCRCRQNAVDEEETPTFHTEPCLSITAASAVTMSRVPIWHHWSAVPLLFLSQVRRMDVKLQLKKKCT